MWRRYRNRYSQYLPVPTYTSGLSNFFAQRFSMLTLPSTWSRNGGSVDNADTDDYLEDGEELGNVDPRIVNVIRQAISRGNEHTRRLSREYVAGPSKRGDLFANECTVLKRDSWTTVTTTTNRRGDCVQSGLFHLPLWHCYNHVWGINLSTSHPTLPRFYRFHMPAL